MFTIGYAYIDVLVVTLWERSIQHFWAAQRPVFTEDFIFLSRPETSNSRVDFLTNGSSRHTRIVTIRRDISTSGSKAYFHSTLYDPTCISGELGRQQQLTTWLSSCILDMCVVKWACIELLTHSWDYSSCKQREMICVAVKCLKLRQLNSVAAGPLDLSFWDWPGAHSWTGLKPWNGRFDWQLNAFSECKRAKTTTTLKFLFI